MSWRCLGSETREFRTGGFGMTLVRLGLRSRGDGGFDGFVLVFLQTLDVTGFSIRGGL